MILLYILIGAVILLIGLALGFKCGFDHGFDHGYDAGHDAGIDHAKAEDLEPVVWKREFLGEPVESQTLTPSHS